MTRKRNHPDDENLELQFNAPTDTSDRQSPANNGDDGTIDPFALQLRSGHIDDMFCGWFLDYASYVILKGKKKGSVHAF